MIDPNNSIKSILNLSDAWKKYVINDIEMTKEVSDRMNFNNFYVNFAGKTYKANCAEMEQTLGEYPVVKLECEISPRNIVCSAFDLIHRNVINSIENGGGISHFFKIKNVIFNPPATIVFWADGTKTVVKASCEKFDPEKGLAMAIAKKAMGNKGNYFNQIKKWTESYVEEEPPVVTFEKAAEYSKLIGKLFGVPATVVLDPHKDDK